MYDQFLKLSLPRELQIVGFADDVVLMVIGESLIKVEVQATSAVETVENWMCERKLVLAHHKSEVLMISNRKAVSPSTQGVI